MTISGRHLFPVARLNMVLTLKKMVRLSQERNLDLGRMKFGEISGGVLKNHHYFIPVCRNYLGDQSLPASLFSTKSLGLMRTTVRKNHYFRNCWNYHQRVPQMSDRKLRNWRPDTTNVGIGYGPESDRVRWQ